MKKLLILATVAFGMTVTAQNAEQAQIKAANAQSKSANAQASAANAQTAAASAQERVALAEEKALKAKEEMVYKPVAGQKTVELQLGGGILNTSFSRNNIADNAGFKGRYFTAANKAYRFGFNLGSSSATTPIIDPTVKEGTETVSSADFTISAGIENHFAGTKKLSPYFGYDAIIGFGSSSTSSEGTTVGDVSYSSKNSAGSNLTFGVQGVIGADYYIVKNVYVGAEAGLRFAFNANGKSSTTSTMGGTTTSSDGKSSSSFGFAPFVAGVKVGWVF